MDPKRLASKSHLDERCAANFTRSCAQAVAPTFVFHFVTSRSNSAMLSAARVSMSPKLGTSGM